MSIEIQCLDDREPPVPILAFLAPKWRHIDPANPLREMSGLVTRTEVQTKTGIGLVSDIIEKIPLGIGTWLVQGFIFLAGSPFSLGLAHRLATIRPDLDRLIFVVPADPGLAVNLHGVRNETGEMECEINPDRHMNTEWFPPVGKMVRMLGHWVEDASHDNLTEIHPIHWLTWEVWRLPNAVCYRVTVMADVSGRFPPYAATPPDRRPPNRIEAGIQYRMSVLFPNLPQGQTVACDIRHENSADYDFLVLDSARCRRDSAETFTFQCAVSGRDGSDAENCNTTERENNSGGIWDGFVVFYLTVGIDPSHRRGPGIIDVRLTGEGEAPPKPSKPNIRIEFSSVVLDEFGGLNRQLGFAADCEARGFDPRRDSVRWTLIANGESRALPSEGITVKANVELPFQALRPAEAERTGRQEKDTNGWPAIEVDDPGKYPLFLMVTITREGRSESAIEMFRAPYVEVGIVESWRLESSERGSEAGPGRAVFRVSLTPQLRSEIPESAVFVWSVVAPREERFSIDREAVLRINYSPDRSGQGAYVVRVEIYDRNRRIAAGRKLIFVPLPSLTLEIMNGGGEEVRITARPKEMIGEVNFLWAAGSSTPNGAMWTAAHDTLTVRFSRPAATGVFAVATDSVGQVALASVSFNGVESLGSG